MEPQVEPVQIVPIGGAPRARAAGGPFDRAPADVVTLAPLNAVRGRDGRPLDEAKQGEVRRLREVDRRVRAHEAAHQAASGGSAGGASFGYTIGPDGQAYAVSGEVPIRFGGGRTPDEVIAAARRVRAAALAPPDPSAQDLAVASQASLMESRALAEKARLKAAQDASRSRQARSAAPEAEPAAPATGGEPAAPEQPKHRHVTAYERMAAAHLAASDYAAEALQSVSVQLAA